MINLRDNVLLQISDFGMGVPEVVNTFQIDGKTFLENYKTKLIAHAVKIGEAADPDFLEMDLKPIETLLASTVLKSTKEMYKLSNGATMKAIMLETENSIYAFMKCSEKIKDFSDGEEMDGVIELHINQITPSEYGSGINFLDEYYEESPSLVQFLNIEVDSGI